MELMHSLTLKIVPVELGQRKSDIGREESAAARVLQRTQAVQDHPVSKPATAGLGFAPDAPSRSVDAATIYVATPGAQPVERTTEAGARCESRFHVRIVRRVDSGKGGQFLTMAMQRY